MSSRHENRSTDPAPEGSTSTTRTAETSFRKERVLATPRIFKPNDDPVAWLAHFETIARGNHWVGAAKLDALGVYLGGTAQSWYEAQHQKWRTFEEFKLAFTDRYHTPMLMAQACEEARSYRQSDDQTVEEVIVDMDRIFSAAKIVDDLAKKTFLSAALKPEIRTFVLRGEAETYEEMCELASKEGQVLATVEAQERYHPLAGLS
ncbi:hypothetical protein BGZ50_000913, partial [Haplosporangium sp. Z 11]